VLATANALRFPMLAGLIASRFPHVGAVPAVLAYAILSLAVAAPYLAWRRRVHGTAGAHASSGAGARDPAPRAPAP
jgi:hypothetical protein